jgi:hypothetical protein
MCSILAKVHLYVGYLYGHDGEQVVLGTRGLESSVRHVVYSGERCITHHCGHEASEQPPKLLFLADVQKCSQHASVRPVGQQGHVSVSE